MKVLSTDGVVYIRTSHDTPRDFCETHPVLIDGMGLQEQP